ncbi:MAG: hypothetical protein H7178_00525 [Chitinophagaceae bacterium]|nr:hypothetical protein [Chitinophagaceae bacterium]
MKDFGLRGCFNDHNIPDIHLEQLKPLDKIASEFLWNYISDSELHDNVPFKINFFKTIDKAKIELDNKAVIKKWLYQRGLPFDKQVFLSWQPNEAMIVPWKLFIKYFDSFYHSDDLTIIDQSLTWALLFYHESEIYFGTKSNFKPSEDFANRQFIW